MLPISACLADNMHEPIDVSQANDNEPFNEYNSWYNCDDYNQGDYPIASNDDIKAFISIILLYTYSVCMYV